MRPHHLATLLLVTLTAAAQTPAAPATAPPPRAFTALRSSPSFDQALLSAFQSYESLLSTQCPKVDFAAKHPPLILDPFQLDPDGNITSAAWIESQDGTACGQARRYNALVLIRDGKNLILPQFPGQTNASPQLQHDSLQFAATAIPTSASCRLQVLDTTLVAGPPSRLPSGLLAPWDELWSIRACSDTFSVTMHFLPSATSTTIHTSPSETHKQ